MRQSELFWGLHIEGEAGSLVVIIVEIVIYFLLNLFSVLFLVFGISKAFFSKDPVKSFNKGLLILFVWSGCSYGGDMLYGILLPIILKLRPSVSLNMVNRLEFLSCCFNALSPSLEVREGRMITLASLV